MKKTAKNIGYNIEYWILAAAILILWAVMEKTGQLNEVVLPGPSRILTTLWKLVTNGTLFTNLLVSIVRVLKGYFIASVLGIAVGIFLGLSHHLNRLTEFLIQIIKPIPPIAWIPLVILWFGIGEEGKIFLIFLGGFFTILINVTDGIKQTDIKLIEVADAMETPFLKKVFRLIIPYSAPNIFTGLRTGLSSCWMCVVAAELVSSSTGLGYMIMNARQFGQIDVVIVGMLTIGICGKVMDSILKKTESIVIRWN